MDKENSFDFIYYLRAAHADYNDEVKPGKKTYSRFCKDFINGHIKPAQGEDDNEHSRIMGSICDLLTQRQSLVEHYFAQEELTDEQLHDLQAAHESTDAGKHAIEKMARKVGAWEGQAESLAMNLSPDQLKIIGDLMCGKAEGFARLVPDDMEVSDALFFLNGKKRLKVLEGQGYKMFMLLDALAFRGLISQGWRGFLSCHGSLISPVNGQPMTQRQMYRSLCDGKNKHWDLYAQYLEKALEIAGGHRGGGVTRWM